MSVLPTISAIIPTFNRAGLLGRAIRSVLAQTFQDWELLEARLKSPAVTR